MKQILLLCLTSITLSLHSQVNVDFFTSGSIYTGITNKVTNLHSYFILDHMAHIDLFYAPEPLYVNSESMIGMTINTGIILQGKWYFSAGLRYDTRRFSTCYYCSSSEPALREAEQDIQSRAFEIPFTAQYRIIPDLPVSPILHAESFLAFRENSETGYYYNFSKRQQMFGFRLGVGLNYQIGEIIELNLIGTWGKAKTSDGLSFIKWEGENDFYFDQKITDYQLSFGLISKFGG